jgi:hypothetical protein
MEGQHNIVIFDLLNIQHVSGFNRIMNVVLLPMSSVRPTVGWPDSCMTAFLAFSEANS